MVTTIVHYYPRILAGNGGPTIAARGWAMEASRRGHNVSVVYDESQGTVDPSGFSILNSDVRLLPVYHRSIAGHLLPSPIALKHALQSADFLVTHSGYAFGNWIAVATATMLGIPYVVVPHGVYHARSRAVSNLLKSVVAPIERTILGRANGVHAFTRGEEHEVRRFQQSASTFVAPPGVSAHTAHWSPSGGRRTIVWIGRFDIAHKGLDLLMSAMSSLRPALRPKLVIRGRDSRQTLHDILMLRKQYSLSSVDVLVGGPITGREKTDLLLSAAGYVHPSRWESFGFGLLDPMALGVPCIVSEGCDLAPQLDSWDAALIVPGTTEGLSSALEWVTCASQSELAALGQRGRDVIATRFSWDATWNAYREATGIERLSDA